MNNCNKIQRWKVFIARTVFMFIIQGTVRSAGELLQGTVKEFHTSVPLAGWAFTLLAGLTFLSAPFVQLVLKALSYRLSAVIGGFLFAAGIMYVGLFANTAWQLFLCLILSGIGSGAIALPTFIALRDCFENSFGTVNSATLLVSNVSGFVFPLVVEYWKTKYGFRPTILLTGAMGLHFVIAAVCLPSTRESTSTRKEKKEPSLDVKNETGVSKFLYTAHPSLFTLCVFLTTALVQLMGFSVYLYPYGLSKGFDGGLCAVIVSLSGIGSLIGRITTICYYHWNLISNPTVVASPYLILLVMQIWSITSTNVVVVIVMAFVSGIVAGQSTAWATSIVKDLSCTIHFNSAATWLSFWGGIGSTFGGLIVGWTHELRGSYEDVMIFLALLSVLEVILIYLTLCPNRYIDNGRTNDCRSSPQNSATNK